jgi:hypothetical protein
VVLKLAARHAERTPLELLAREIAPAGCAMAQGMSGLLSGRPKATPVIRLFSFLIDKPRVPAHVEIDGAAVSLEDVVHTENARATPEASIASFDASAVAARDAKLPRHTHPLRAIAWGRSGDKGDACNIGLIARHPAFVALIAEQITPERVAARFAYVARGKVRRYAIPGFHAFNFMLEHALGGGGAASLRYDPQGKTFAQILLDEPVLVPDAWLDGDGRPNLSHLGATHTVAPAVA